MTTTAQLGISYHDFRQGGLMTTFSRVEITATTGPAIRAALAAELRALIARRDPTVDSASITLGRHGATVYNDGGKWVLAVKSPRVRLHTEVLA